MNLTLQQRAELIAKYAPVVLWRHDAEHPVDPSEYLRGCELWVGDPSAPDDKFRWGLPDGSLRSPNLRRGQVTPQTLATAMMFTRSDMFRGDVWLTEHAWKTTREVSSTSDNSVPARLAAHAPERTRRPVAFRAEVVDATQWRALSRTQAANDLSGLDADALLSCIESVVAIQYYFLFPAAHAAATQHDRQGGQQFVVEYQGDWHCCCLYLKPTDATGAFEGLRPFHLALSRKSRGVSPDLGPSGEWHGFARGAWKDSYAIKDHVVLAANPCSNHLSLALVDPAPGEAAVKPQFVEFGKTHSDGTGKGIKEMVEHNQNGATAAVAVSVAKILAGAAILGPLGAIGGLVAGIAEADEVMHAVNHGELPETNPEDRVKEIESDDSTEVPFEYGDEHHNEAGHSSDLTLEQIRQAISSRRGIDPNIAESSLWLRESMAPLDAAAEPFWWASEGDRRRGFRGRWGARCERDAFQRRAGGVLPDYTLLALRDCLSAL